MGRGPEEDDSGRDGRRSWRPGERDAFGEAERDGRDSGAAIARKSERVRIVKEEEKAEELKQASR